MADKPDNENEQIGLHTLKPAPGSRKARKRIGRGEGSGTGKTAGRGHKGAGSRSGSKERANAEGGQVPMHMRMRKLRGPHMKKSMPFEQFRTHTQPVNLGDLDQRFDSGAEVTLEALRGKGLGTRKGISVKVLAKGEITKPLTVHAHAFSATARERIEATVTSSPFSKRASRSSRLTACVCVRNISNGIDFFMCGPRSLRIRM